MSTLALVVFSAIFVWGGVQQLVAPSQFVEQARRAAIPSHALLVRGHGVVMLAATAALQLPEWRFAGALLLAAQLPAMTWIAHRFWTIEPGPMRNTQRTQFLKNISLFGALLAIAALR